MGMLISFLVALVGVLMILIGITAAIFLLRSSVGLWNSTSDKPTLVWMVKVFLAAGTFLLFLASCL